MTDVVKTISFASGKVLIGKVNEYGCWKDAMFVGIVRHPETGERSAFFTPAVPGRDNQDLNLNEVNSLIGENGHVGPDLAANGLADAYKRFVSDDDAVARCVRVNTVECGPSNSFIGTLPECDPADPKVECKDGVLFVEFKKELKNLDDM